MENMIHVIKTLRILCLPIKVEWLVSTIKIISLADQPARGSGLKLSALY